MSFIAPQSRLDELTAMRGIAALCVVFLHAKYEWNAVFTTGQQFTNLISAGGLWVHFFFILSGFVIAHAYTKQFARAISPLAYGRFLWIRFGRIYPLYLAVLLAWIALVLMGWIPVNDPAGSLAASFFLVQGFVFGDDVWNYPGWSISAEWVAYVAFPFIALLLGRFAEHAIRTLAIALFVGVVFLWGFAPATSDQPSIAIAYCLVEFSLGCAVHRLVEDAQRGDDLPSRLAGLIVCAPVLLLALPPNPASRWILGLAAASCALSIGIVATQATPLDRLLQARPMQILGVISYSIYLDHALLFRTVKAAVNALSGQARFIENLGPASALMAFVAYLALLIAVSWATYRVIEEPARLWFKRSVTNARLADSRLGVR